MEKDQIKKVLEDSPPGDVVKWTASEKYTYAALLVETGGWFTTARSTNLRVPEVVTTDKLAEILSRPEVSGIEFADEWTDPREYFC